jgi:hypothetical protein
MLCVLPRSPVGFGRYVKLSQKRKDGGVPHTGPQGSLCNDDQRNDFGQAAALGRKRPAARNIKRAYVDMAKAEKGYRPGPPSDGLGNILLDGDALADPVRLEIEAWQAAKTFCEAEEKMLFEVRGRANGTHAATMYLALQAAQLCCSSVTARPTIRQLLELAIAALPTGE